uniref:Protein HTATIP2 n=1 Tax=Anser cygnoides TaxID=8845 RepID=A0A8B9EJG8_ANSCY
MAAAGGSGAGSCFVLGASGATGRALLRELRARRLFARVTVIGRRRLSLAEESGTAVEQVVVDFERLSEHAAAFRGHDVGFCCLGTTRSKAGAGEVEKLPDPRVSSPRRVLLCARQEFRPMEWITQHVLGAVAWLFPTAYSVPVETVARAMVASVLQPGKGKVEVLENKAIHQLGKAQPQLGT